MFAGGLFEQSCPGGAGRGRQPGWGLKWCGWVRSADDETLGSGCWRSLLEVPP